MNFQVEAGTSRLPLAIGGAAALLGVILCAWGSWKRSVWKKNIQIHAAHRRLQGTRTGEGYLMASADVEHPETDGLDPEVGRGSDTMSPIEAAGALFETGSSRKLRRAGPNDTQNDSGHDAAVAEGSASGARVYSDNTPAASRKAKTRWTAGLEGWHGGSRLGCSRLGCTQSCTPCPPAHP